jgi:hypothetical protein
MLVGSGNCHCIDMTGDHRIDNLNLPGVVCFFAGSIPEDGGREVAGGFVYTGVNGLKEQVGRGLSHDADDILARAVAGGNEWERNAREETPPDEH